MPSQNVRNETSISSGRESWTYVSHLKSRTWLHSPRVNGRLALRSNSYKYRNQQWVPVVVGDFTSFSYAYNAGGSIRVQFRHHLDGPIQQLYNSAYGKIRGKLYKGNAALGVTFGSLGQTREMVTRRAQQLGQRADDAFSKLVKAGKKGPRALVDAAASTHLEVIFGWTPLLADIHNSCMTVIQEADKNVFVNATAESPIAFQVSGGTNPSISREAKGKLRVRLSSRVVIANPNAWLLERAGLLNPAAVAWDLVPWSFVVNMFVNTGALVNSITDFAGLSFPDATRTDTVSLVMNSACTYSGKTTKITTGEVWKDRDLTSFPAPSLEFRIPEAKWETAAMAASLFAQKFVRLSRGMERATKGLSPTV